MLGSNKRKQRKLDEQYWKGIPHADVQVTDHQMRTPHPFEEHHGRRKAWFFENVYVTFAEDATAECEFEEMLSTYGEWQKARGTPLNAHWWDQFVHARRRLPLHEDRRLREHR